MKVVILLQITLIQIYFTDETSSQIKFISQQYRRHKLHTLVGDKSENLIKNVSYFFENRERYGEYLKYMNISQCYDGDKGENKTYIKRHVLKGLLVDDLPNKHWTEYKSVYNKVYASSHQEMTAKTKWRRNLRRVAYYNRLYLNGKIPYSLHLNYFGDWGSYDFIKNVLKLRDTIQLFDPAFDRYRISYHMKLHHKVPTQVDWRAKGYQPRREQQWSCGACYAFAVTHALQAQLYKRHGDWRELSPQQIVDCSLRDGNMGCDGGSLRATMRYAARAGLIPETQYPYMGEQGRCKYNRFHVKVKPRRWAILPSGDEKAMERALANIGPLAVAVNAAPFTFQLYRGGVYDDPFCTPWQVNHAMLLVGYTPRYWILLNWWGRHWGEDGYIRIRRGFNRCGVANMATYIEL